MATITVTTAGKIEVVGIPVRQMTLVCTEAILAGSPVRIHTDGKWTNANGSSAGEARIWGIAVASKAAGEALTAVRNGILDGFTTDMAYDAAVYVGNTDALLQDTAGTVSTVVGRILPGTSEVLGGSYAKLLSVEL